MWLSTTNCSHLQIMMNRLSLESQNFLKQTNKNYELFFKNEKMRSFLLERYPEAINNTALIENFSLDSKADLNRLININNIYFNLEKIRRSDTRCARFSQRHLRDAFNVDHYSNVMGEIHMNCPFANWAFLCDLSPKFKKQEISKYIGMITMPMHSIL